SPPLHQGPAGPRPPYRPAFRQGPRVRAEAEALHATIRGTPGRFQALGREQAQIASASDRRAVAAQLGRDPDIPFTVVARCGPGHPLVIRNHPVDQRGNPFPTLYWLTCPDSVKAISRVKSAGWIKRLNDQAEVDPDLRTGLRRAHEEYARAPGELVPGAERWGGGGGTAPGHQVVHSPHAPHPWGGAAPGGGL